MITGFFKRHLIVTHLLLSVMVVLLVFLAFWQINRKNDLIFALYHSKFSADDHSTIYFSDFRSYESTWDGFPDKKDSGTWAVTMGLTNIYLRIDDYEMALTELSDSVIVFSAGEFEPTFIRVK